MGFHISLYGGSPPNELEFKLLQAGYIGDYLEGDTKSSDYGSNAVIEGSFKFRLRFSMPYEPSARKPSI